MNLGCADGLGADTLLLLLLHLVATEGLRVVAAAVFGTKLSGGIDLAWSLEPVKPNPLGKVMAPLSMKEAIDDVSLQCLSDRVVGNNEAPYHQ